MEPVKIKILGIKMKAPPSNLNAPNIKTITDHSENMKTEENIQSFFNLNSNWNIMEPTSTYLSKSQLDPNPKEIDPSRFVNFSKYIDVAQICKQDLNDQRIDLLEYNKSIGNSIILDSPQKNNDIENINNNNNNNDDSHIYQIPKKKEEMTAEEKNEIKEILMRKKKKLQIKNQQLVTYFADRKRNIFSIDPSLKEEEKKKKEKLYRKPDFLGQQKKELVNDEKTVKFIENNWFLFSQSAKTPEKYMKGLKKVKDVYEELRSRIQKQQEENIQLQQQAVIEQILSAQGLASPTKKLNFKKPQTSQNESILCMKTTSDTPKKNERRQFKNSLINQSKAFKYQNSLNLQQHSRSADTSFKKIKNYSASPVSISRQGIFWDDQNQINASNNYYQIENTIPLSYTSQVIYEKQQQQNQQQQNSQLQSRFVKQVNDNKSFNFNYNGSPSMSPRIIDSRVRTTQDTCASSNMTQSRQYNSRKNTEQDITRNKSNILKINSCNLQKRVLSQQPPNKNRNLTQNSDQIFNFCHSQIGESDTINAINNQEEQEIDGEYDDFKIRSNQSANGYNDQSSQLSQRSYLSTTTLQESSRGTNSSLDLPASYITRLNFINKKRKYLNMNEIKISTFTAKEQYLQEHNPLKYELYVVPQTTKELISKANKSGQYLYQKPLTPKNYGQFSNIKRELIIS